MGKGCNWHMNKMEFPLILNIQMKTHNSSCTSSLNSKLHFYEGNMAPRNTYQKKKKKIWTLFSRKWPKYRYKFVAFTWQSGYLCCMYSCMGGGSSCTRGGTQIWFGWECTAEDLKPISISRGNFSENRYPFLGIFPKNKYPFCHKNMCQFLKNFQCLLREPKKILKNRHFARDFLMKKWDPCLGVSCKKMDPFMRNISYVLICEYPTLGSCSILLFSEVRFTEIRCCRQNAMFSVVQLRIIENFEKKRTCCISCCDLYFLKLDLLELFNFGQIRVIQGWKNNDNMNDEMFTCW